eukprot:g1905.t1
MPRLSRIANDDIHPLSIYRREIKHPETRYPNDEEKDNNIDRQMHRKRSHSKRARSHDIRPQQQKKKSRSNRTNSETMTRRMMNRKVGALRNHEQGSENKGTDIISHPYSTDRKKLSNSGLKSFHDESNRNTNTTITKPNTSSPTSNQTSLSEDDKLVKQYLNFKFQTEHMYERVFTHTSLLNDINPNNQIIKIPHALTQHATATQYTTTNEVVTTDMEAKEQLNRSITNTVDNEEKKKQKIPLIDLMASIPLSEEYRLSYLISLIIHNVKAEVLEDKSKRSRSSDILRQGYRIDKSPIQGYHIDKSPIQCDEEQILESTDTEQTDTNTNDADVNLGDENTAKDSMPFYFLPHHLKFRLHNECTRDDGTRAWKCKLTASLEDPNDRKDEAYIAILEGLDLWTEYVVQDQHKDLETVRKRCVKKILEILLKNDFVKEMGVNPKNLDDFVSRFASESPARMIFWDNRLSELAQQTVSVDPNNERLEFLGDAVLNLCIATQLFKSYPSFDPGTLTQTKQMIECNSSFAKLAVSIGIDKHVKVAENVIGERDISVDKAWEKILANVFEAYFGAIMVESGIRIAHKVYESLNIKADPSKRTSFNPIGSLHEYFNTHAESSPQFSFSKEGSMFQCDVNGELSLFGHLKVALNALPSNPKTDLRLPFFGTYSITGLAITALSNYLVMIIKLFAVSIWKPKNFAILKVPLSSTKMMENRADMILVTAEKEKLYKKIGDEGQKLVTAIVGSASEAVPWELIEESSKSLMYSRLRMNEGSRITSSMEFKIEMYTKQTLEQAFC